MLRENETIVDKDILLELLGKCNYLNKIDKYFSEIGINLIVDGKYRNIDEVFEELSEKLKSLEVYK